MANNHLDIRITSDTNNIALVQLMYKNDSAYAPYQIIKMYGPTNLPWIQYSDYTQTYSGYSMVIQNRKQYADASYWVSWIDMYHFNRIPPGIYGVDFTGHMEYSDLSIEYGTIDESGNTNSVGESWTFCERTGEIGSTTPTPTPSITPIPTETPSPTPTETPSPLPTPTATPSPEPTLAPTPSPQSVTKVVLVLGLGASWNIVDFMSCSNQTTGEWTLAPYAKSSYEDLITALSSKEWIVKPFYYDWRKNPTINTDKLTSFVDSQVEKDEKVNLVGHSLGGILGMSYLQKNSGGKLAKFLSVGAPLQGSTYAYPAWEGGEVWNSNLIEQIGIDLYLKHCGSLMTPNRITIQTLFPSVQSLLPTEPYLKNFATESLINTNSMQVKNNFLPLSPAPDFWGVKTAALSGKNQKTLKNIVVIPPTKSYLQLGNWVDGVPVSKEFTNDGDGTVLTSSSTIPGAENMSIEQSHRGLVATTEGINTILNFLGSPGIEDPPYSEPTSALVVIGYPGSFSIIDTDEHKINSQDGMVAIMDPKEGDYQLKISTTSDQKTFIVGQFFSTGQVLYKEYKLNSSDQNDKVIKFSSKNPNADALKDKLRPSSDKPGFYFQVPRIPIIKIIIRNLHSLNLK